jgi:hypothetical protein
MSLQTVDAVGYGKPPPDPPPWGGLREALDCPASARADGARQSTAAAIAIVVRRSMSLAILEL